MTEADAFLFFTTLDGIGPLHFNLLVEYFGSARKAFHVTKEQLSKLGLRGVKVDHIIGRRNEFNLELEQKKLAQKNIWFVGRSDKEYPEKLKQLKDAPIGLFGQGERKKFAEFLKSPTIAVVGSRKMTSYGRNVTKNLVADLVAYGFTVVSGLMYGVDETAHREVLLAKGNTIGVWAGGVDTVFQCSRRRLASDVVQENVIISEYPLGLAPTKGTFPARNRIVSGLSLGALIIEGTKDSGSLITARLAAEQGREVFAVPGSVLSEQSSGPASLIKKGAKLVSNIDDIIEELGSNIGPLHKGSKSGRISYIPKNKAEEKILHCLRSGEKYIDEIVREVHLSSTEVSGTISLLELNGIIENLEGRYFIKITKS